jgi:hypothetical protein
MISASSSGNFNKSLNFLNTMKNRNTTIYGRLQSYAAKGVYALQEVTPLDSGKTSQSWDYKILLGKNNASIIWTNSNVINGVNIAILIQYGHATKNGGYVEGYDYINPAMNYVIDEILNDVWQNIANS